MELPILKIDGTQSGKTAVLSDNIFAVEPNDHAIYLDVVQYLANQRQGTSKTKDGILDAIKAGDRKILFVLPENSQNIYLSSRNLPQVKVITVDEINTYAIMNACKLVMVDGVQDILAERNAR